MVTPMRHLPELALCFVTLLWGATFLFIRLAMEECGPFFFVGLRFGTAALILFALALPTLKDITLHELFAGAVLGLIVFGGFILQTAGLAHVDASKSAFLTAFYVPLVPLLEWIIFRRRPKTRSMVGLALAFVGVLLVAGVTKGVDFRGSPGEFLTLGCSLLFALEIVCTGFFAPRCDTRRLTFLVMSATSLLAFALMPVTGESVPADLPMWVWVMATGLGCATALIQSVIVWAQKSISPSRATLIYSAEPVWGGFFGHLAGERLAVSALVGCGLILSGLLVELPGSGKRKGAKDASPDTRNTPESAEAGEEESPRG